MSGAESTANGTQAGLDEVRADRSWVALVGTLLVVGGLGFAAGPAGALAGGVAVLAWATLPDPFPFAVAGTAVAATAGLSLAPGVLVAAAGALLALGTALGGANARVKATVAGLATLAGLGTVALGASRVAGTVAAAAAVAAVAAVAAYGLHRYERVSLGLVQR